MGGCQIDHWVQTGEFVLRAKDDKSCAPAPPMTEDNFASVHLGCRGVKCSTIHSPPSIYLVPEEHDVLVPTKKDIDRVLDNGYATWSALLGEAEALPSAKFPAPLADPYITLKDVPALPSPLPWAEMLIGHTIWKVPDPEREDELPDTVDSKMIDDQPWDLQYIHGPVTPYCLSVEEPIACHAVASPSTAGDGPTSVASGLLILTLCWSYILSVRQLELQNRQMVYSDHVLVPRSIESKPPGRQPGQVTIDLTGESVPGALIPWMCAILAPKLGWMPDDDDDDLPPWTSVCSEGAEFVIYIDHDKIGDLSSENNLPPSSAQATELLIHLCWLYGLVTPKNKSSSKEHALIDPPFAAFVAALALPFYRDNQLQPQFATPKLRRLVKKGHGIHPEFSRLCQPIRRYVSDLRYFMSLSLNTYGLGSVLFSVFWHPEIECNLVSPWLRAVLQVVQPSIDSKNMLTVVKLFAVRRPRAAIWWLGLYLLGDHSTLFWIGRYLETLEEREGFGTMSPPDPTMAAWTGIPHSFLDEESPNPYPEKGQLVSRSDLLRHRHNFALQNTTTSTRLSWLPFGSVRKDEIEPDVWPWLESGCRRKYIGWVWYIDDGSQHTQRFERGFSRQTRRFVSGVPDRVREMKENGGGDIHFTSDCIDIRVEPSKLSTLRMVSLCMLEMNGDKDTSVSTVKGVKGHKWLDGWRGL